MFTLWLSIGLQSFGGGVATLTLIRRMAVERSAWMTEDEFTRDWALCQMAPGINLLALTILIGRRAAGLRGIAPALAGLLLPSGAVTILLTGLYTSIRGEPAVQAALRGVIPATVGLGVITSWQIARPILVRSRAEGRASLAWSAALVGGSALATVAHVSTTTVLLAASAAGATMFWGRSIRADRREKRR
jgi:chromate transporter